MSAKNLFADVLAGSARVEDNPAIVLAVSDALEAQS